MLPARSVSLTLRWHGLGLDPASGAAPVVVGSSPRSALATHWVANWQPPLGSVPAGSGASSTAVLPLVKFELNTLQLLTAAEPSPAHTHWHPGARTATVPPRRGNPKGKLLCLRLQLRLVKLTLGGAAMRAGLPFCPGHGSGAGRGLPRRPKMCSFPYLFHPLRGIPGAMLLAFSFG